MVWGPVHRGLCILHHGWAQGGLAWQGYQRQRWLCLWSLNLFFSSESLSLCKAFLTTLWLVVCVWVLLQGSQSSGCQSLPFPSGSYVSFSQMSSSLGLLIAAGPSGNFPHASPAVLTVHPVPDMPFFSLM